MLLFSGAVAGQSCEYYLPYNQNFNQGFDLQVGYFNPAYDTSLVYNENCWTQCLYRSSGRWSFVSHLPNNSSGYALRLYASHPFDGDDRVEYTYMLSPAFRDDPTTIMFDYCNQILSTEKDGEGQWIDITHERTGILQLGYITDTLQPESSYHAITNIVMDPADGATDVVVSDYRFSTVYGSETGRAYWDKILNIDSLRQVAIKKEGERYEKK